MHRRFLLPSQCNKCPYYLPPKQSMLCREYPTKGLSNRLLCNRQCDLHSL